jgi:hypothetical protein
VKLHESERVYWRFSSGIPGTYDASLLAVDASNATFASSWLNFTVVIDAGCSLRRPTIAIDAPFKCVRVSVCARAYRALVCSYPRDALPDAYERLSLEAHRALDVPPMARDAVTRLAPSAINRVNFTLFVTNNDVGAACGAASFGILADLNRIPNPNYYYYHSPPYDGHWSVSMLGGALLVAPNTTAARIIQVRVARVATGV